MVRSKLSGKWKRRFFKTKGEAKTHVDIKRIELRNQGREGAMFPAALRVMAQRCAQKLEPFGKSIDDATDFYLNTFLQRNDPFQLNRPSTNSLHGDAISETSQPYPFVILSTALADLLRRSRGAVLQASRGRKLSLG